ncbi:single-stranded DNA-binding protein [Nocardia transvalensis]|uniref:single-stranded DNA-binding protein n=1 Tax=Nocardia transvalensis TaxID=37333 RepID=UPI0018938904|nr:single-stranded DNA-binding protein [Nocardia transvalensis]MBF6331883.1 single-stranded DNA-binding protein [Nocardia transvalensis]
MPTVNTYIGNLVAPPELKYTSAGVPFTHFTIADTPRRFDRTSGEWKDGDALFLRCNAWRDAAENLANSELPRGARVIVTGRLKQRTYQTLEGDKRTVIEFEVDEMGPSTRWATAKVTRVARKTSSNGASQGPATDDPWNMPSGPDPVFAGSAVGGFADEPTF